MESKIKPNELIYSQFEYAFSVIDKCTDDYIFILDFKDDCYSISESAVERFCLPSEKFNNVSENLKSTIHPADFDMIVKNLDDIVNGRTEEHNFEYRWLTVDGEYVWISCRGQVVFDKDGSAAYLAGRISEIGSLKRADNITGLLTDVQLNRDYRELISQNGFISGYLMRIRIDNFKEMNRRYGKTLGDEVLKIFGRILEEAVGENGKAYRYENSGFVIFNYDGGKIEDAQRLYEDIRKRVEKASEKADYRVFFTVSAGVVAILPNKVREIDEIYKRAEFAIYLSENRGTNNIIIFDNDEYNDYIRHINIQENLRMDIKNDFRGFELYYQPIVSAFGKNLIGAEALLRWESKEYGKMSPVEFIPILEESGLIVPLGKWIFKTAIKQCKAWQEFIPEFKMNINISYVQLRTSDVLQDINKCLEEVGLDPKYICVEITESGHLDMDNSLIEEFYKNNFKLAIDDFGTGYSNMRYLQYLNVDIIKIDRSFAERATKSLYDYKIVKHIIDMAHSVDLDICLEGIETEEELEIIETLRPDFIQGFYFGKPVPKGTFFENNIEGVF